MEYEACHRQKWRRAPSSVALVCAECKNLVTPCIVCAHAIPFVGDSIWKECGHCGVVNPIRELERCLLGLPSPLALTPSMVRRVTVAHVGRRQYTIALHLLYNQLQRVDQNSVQVDEGIRCCPNKDELPEEKLEKSETVLKAMAKPLPCEWKGDNGVKGKISYKWEESKNKVTDPIIITIPGARQGEFKTIRVEKYTVSNDTKEPFSIGG